MLAKTRSAAVLGVDAHPIDVEVDLAGGLPAYATVGLPDAAVKESKDRIRAAISNTGFVYPLGRITVNLSPADMRKEGSAFDLPIALGLLEANGAAPRDAQRPGMMYLGELALDGALKPVRGALNIAVLAKRMGLAGLVLPAENAAEAAVVDGLPIYPVHTLPQVVGFLRGEVAISAEAAGAANGQNGHAPTTDLSDIRGQHHAKRALEVAAAGGHNLIMIGPPGSGKSMLARRLPSILPRLTLEEAIETSQVWSVLGKLGPAHALVAARPFRAPHHTISDAGMVGGGTIPLPGEASLAHNGVLFLDELPEFRKNVLESLRSPLEEGRLTISRAQASLTFPTRFMLTAAMNPCPCGHLGDPSRACACTPKQIARYRSRISGPLLDRIDLHLNVPRLRWKELAEDPTGESSEAVRARVEAARELQRARFADTPGVHGNAHMGPEGIARFCRTDGEGKKLLERAVEHLGLSARAYHRVLKVARTIADLAGAETIAPAHVAEAIQYRSLDRPI
ncbi:MAG: YifB family Mg chelatase-like AAA ATPase [bacterium]|nr:YifB family Mg chelatase-like AAA ATPase [bacterium]